LGRDAAAAPSNPAVAGHGLLEPEHLVALADTALGEPALVHLQGVFDRADGLMRVLGERLHVLDVENAPVAVDEGDR